MADVDRFLSTHWASYYWDALELGSVVDSDVVLLCWFLLPFGVVVPLLRLLLLLLLLLHMVVVFLSTKCWTALFGFWKKFSRLKGAAIKEGGERSSGRVVPSHFTCCHVVFFVLFFFFNILWTYGFLGFSLVFMLFLLVNLYSFGLSWGPFRNYVFILSRLLEGKSKF